MGPASNFDGGNDRGATSGQNSIVLQEAVCQGATLSKPESAMIDISRLLHVSSGSIVESSAGESNDP